MDYFHGTTDFRMEQASAVTLGKFDGVHLGHQKLMQRIKELEKAQVDSVVFALNSCTKDRILTEEEQKFVIRQMGIFCLIQCPFTPDIAGMEPEQFVKSVLMDRLHAKYIVVGTDFRFGYHRMGDVETLKKLQSKYGFYAEILPKERFKDREISSTYVKEALMEGNMKLANRLLGRPYFVSGIVRHGRKIGRTLGMPTVNLLPVKEKLLPPTGVYVSRTLIGGIFYPGITNIGYKPTVGEKFRGVETYLFDVDMDLYGTEILTELLFFVRAEKRFASLQELKYQMQRDISFGREYFGG